MSALVLESSISPAQFQTIATIAYWQLEVGRPVTDWITPSEWNGLHVRTLTAPARRGVIKYDRDLDVARIADDFEDYAIRAADCWFNGGSL